MHRRPRLRLLPARPASPRRVALAGCGSSDSSSAAVERPAPARRRHDHRRRRHRRPRSTWNGQMTDHRRPDQDADQGDGDTVEDGDKVLAQIWIGNGYTQKTGLQHLRPGQAPQVVTVDDQRQPGLRRRARGPDRRLPGRGDRAGRQGLRRRAATPSSASATRTRPGHHRPRSASQAARRARGQAAAVAGLGPEAGREGRQAVTSASTSAGTPKPDGKLRSAVAHPGHRRDGEEGPDDHRQLPRPGLRRQEALRRELQQATPATFAIGDRRR